MWASTPKGVSLFVVGASADHRHDRKKKRLVTVLVVIMHLAGQNASNCSCISTSLHVIASMAGIATYLWASKPALILQPFRWIWWAIALCTCEKSSDRNLQCKVRSFTQALSFPFSLTGSKMQKVLDASYLPQPVGFAWGQVPPSFSLKTWASERHWDYGGCCQMHRPEWDLAK